MTADELRRQLDEDAMKFYENIASKQPLPKLPPATTVTMTTESAMVMLRKEIKPTPEEIIVEG
jgi:hypothetical protein